MNVWLIFFYTVVLLVCWQWTLLLHMYINSKNTRTTSLSPNTGKCGPEITYLDIFHAVNVFWKPFSAYFCPKNSIERFSWVSGASLVLYLTLFYYLCKMESISIIHLVHTQIFLKKQHFLPPDTPLHMYIWSL